MSIQEHNFQQKKFSINNENSNNLENSEIKINEGQISKSPKDNNQSHHKEKIKNNFLKKINNEAEAISETKVVKVKDLIDDEYINDYNPIIQNNNINPKLQFFVDCESVSESDKDLSSGSLSRDSVNNGEKGKK